MKPVQALICLALWAPVSAFADVSAEENFNFPVNDGAVFKLENVNGNIEVQAWDRSEIVVRAIKSANNREALERIEILVDADADHVSIDTKLGRSSGSWFNWSNNDNGRVSYIIQAPSDVILRSVETVNGDIEVSGMHAEVVVESVNGEINVSGLTGRTTLETVNGEIVAHFDAFDSTQEAEIGTVNGGIEVYLAAGIDANLEAETLNGRISNDFGFEVERSFASREMSGQLGQGGGRMHFETVNGGIRIRSQ